MIKKLRIVNWTSHKESTFEFSDANIFLGVIGSGKSSVVEAIAFALFGSFPELSSRNLTLSDVIRDGERKAIVELSLEIDGKDVFIQRTLERIKDKTKSSAKLFVNKKLISESTTEINHYLEDITGMDLQSFSNTLYASQNKMEAIVELPPSERRKLVDELININRLEKAHKNSISLINRIQRMIKHYKTQVEEINIGDAIKERDKIIKEIEEVENEIKQDKEKFSNASSLLEKVENKYLKLYELKKRYDELSNRLSKTKGIIEELQQYKDIELEDINELEKVILIRGEELKKIDSELEKRKESKEKHLYLLSKYEREEKEGKKRAEEVGEIKLKLKKFDELDIEEKDREIKESIEKLKSKIINLKSKIENGVKSIKDVESSHGKCPLCLKPLDENDKKSIKNHWKQEIELAREKLSIAVERLRKLKEEEEEIEKLKKEYNELRIKLRYFDSEKIDLKELEKQITNTKNIIKELEKEVERLSKKREQLIEERERIRAKIKEAIEVKRKKERFEIAQKNIKKLEEEIKEIKYNEEEIEELREKIKDIAKEKEAYKLKIKEATKLKNEKEKLRKEIEKRIKIFEKISKKIEKLSILLEDISIAKVVIETTQKQARKNLLDSINMSLNTVWNLIYPYEDYPSIKIEAHQNSYSFLLYNGSEWKELERVASGGEKTLFVLALRLAIASVLIGKLDFIILDEPTHNLDDNAVQNLAEVINQELLTITKQFFIITHDERLKNVDMGKVFYFKREKRGNEATSIKVI